MVNKIYNIYREKKIIKRKKKRGGEGSNRHMTVGKGEGGGEGGLRWARQALSLWARPRWAHHAHSPLLIRPVYLGPIKPTRLGSVKPARLGSVKPACLPSPSNTRSVY